jgi:hypothetical protein
MSNVNSQVREIDSFSESASLSRIDIPSAVELTSMTGFSQCAPLADVVFRSDSRLREISGFSECGSLSRIEIPSSVEILFETSFWRCEALATIVFRRDSHPLFRTAPSKSRTQTPREFR